MTKNEMFSIVYIEYIALYFVRIYCLLFRVVSLQRLKGTAMYYTTFVTIYSQQRPNYLGVVI